MFELFEPPSVAKSINVKPLLGAKDEPSTIPEFFTIVYTVAPSTFPVNVNVVALAGPDILLLETNK